VNEDALRCVLFVARQELPVAVVVVEYEEHWQSVA
jgi:hypothetical protein